MPNKSTPSKARKETRLAEARGSALVEVKDALDKDEPIGSYEAYAEWLAAHERGHLYLYQAIGALAWRLHKTGNLDYLRKAAESVTGAERVLVDERLKQNAGGQARESDERCHAPTG